MKPWLFITLLVLSGGPACAEWVPLDPWYQSPGLQTVYVDPGTIRREGQIVTLWQLTDYRWKQGGMIGRRFQSSRTKKEFDCAIPRYRTGAFTDFSGHMGTGDARDGYVEDDGWRPVDPESLNQGLWNMACGKS